MKRRVSPPAPGLGGVIRPRPVDRFLFHPLLSFAYRAIIATAARLPGPLSTQFARNAVSLMIRPFRPVRLRTMRCFLSSVAGTRAESTTVDRSYVRYQARMLLENVHLPQASGERVLRKVRLDGEELIQDALREGQGVIIVFSHVGNWLLAPALLSTRGYRVSGIAYEVPIRGIESHLQNIWKQYNITAYHAGRGSVRAARQALDRNQILMIAFDASVRPGNSRWMPFGSIAILADPGPGKLVRMMQRPVLRMEVRPHDDGTVLHVRPDRSRPDGDPMHDWLAELHAEVSAAPELWWPWSFTSLSEQPGRETNRIRSMAGGAA